jgi:hypothetical protein
VEGLPAETLIFLLSSRDGHDAFACGITWLRPLSLPGIKSGRPDDAMFLPHEANPGRIEFSETTTVLIYANKMAPASGPFPFFRVV